MQLVAEKLIVCRGARRVVDGVSFTVGSGEALVVTGANGAGKTTLLRAIGGLIGLESGVLRLDGAGGEEASIGERCHFVGHLSGTKASLAVEGNLRFWADYLASGDEGTAAGARVDAALDRFGLRDLATFPAGFLSAGQRRRLGLARLLVAKRPLWLLDEPTASLDAASAAVLAAVIGEHLAGGGLAVAATHQPLGIAGAKSLQLGVAAEAA